MWGERERGGGVEEREGLQGSCLLSKVCVCAKYRSIIFHPELNKKN